MGLKSNDIDYGTDGAGELDERQNPLWHACRKECNYCRGGGDGISGSHSGQTNEDSCESSNKKSSPSTKNTAGSSTGEGVSCEPYDSDIPQNLVAEMQAKGVKFKRDELKFVIRDSSGQIVWLGEGNSLAGLTHIIANHADQFKTAFGISEKDIPNYIKTVLTNGKIISEKREIIGKRSGISRWYYYNGYYHLFTTISDNGFIVTSFPRKDIGEIQK